jgi:hypothetical protein
MLRTDVPADQLFLQRAVEAHAAAGDPNAADNDGHIYVLFDDGELVYTKAGPGKFMRRRLHTLAHGDALGRRAPSGLQAAFPHVVTRERQYRYCLIKDGVGGRQAAEALRADLMRLLMRLT